MDMTPASESKSAAPTSPTAQPAAAAKKQLKVDVTASAVAQIEKMQQKREGEGKPRAPGLRIGIRGGGCTGFGYLFEWADEEPRPTDRIFEFPLPSGDGRVKVFVDPKSLIFLDGLTLDYVTSMMGHGFKFVNPNVKSTCGCGESVQF